MKGYNGQYSGTELRDIYYLFSVYEPKFDEIIKDRFPELMKYKNILYHFFADVTLFKGDYPDFFRDVGHFYGPCYPVEIETESYNEGISFVAFLLDILFQIEDKDLPLIDDQLLDLCDHNYKDSRLYKLKTFLLPKQMVEERENVYAETFILHFNHDFEVTVRNVVNYHNLVDYDNKLIEFRRRIHHRYNVKDAYFFYLILAYFYANSEQYNNDFNILDNMLLNFYDKDEMYLREYKGFYPYKDDFYMYSDYTSIYKFISKIADELAVEIKDSKKILTEEKKKDIERVSDEVISGTMTFPEACKYLEETYGFKNCLFYQNGIAILEYQNGDYIEYNYYGDNGCQYREKRSR